MLPKYSPPIPALDELLSGIDPVTRSILLIVGVSVFTIMFVLVIKRKNPLPTDSMLFCNICNKLFVRRIDAIKHITLKHSINYKNWCDGIGIVMCTTKSEFTSMIDFFFTHEPIKDGSEN